MGWEKESKKWQNGNVPPDVDVTDVLGWLKNDPVWKHANIDYTPNRGSHFAVVRIPNIGRVLSQCAGDKFDLSSTDGGRRVKKYMIDVLVKMHAELKYLEK